MKLTVMKVFMKVKVNQELHSGTGLCISNCPEVFKLNDGTANVKMKEIPRELRGKDNTEIFSN